MIQLAKWEHHSHNDGAGLNSPVEIGLSDNQGGHTAIARFFFVRLSVPRFGGAWRGRIRARQFLDSGRPTTSCPASIDWSQWGGLKPLIKSAHTMPKTIPARHIHKTLSYLSPEKYAALRHPMPFKRLPFVHVGKLRVNSYWAVPATGEYFGGYEVGETMAKAFLKHLAESKDSLDAYMLMHIIEGQNDRLEDAIERNQCKNIHVNNWPSEPSSLRGQQAGFINTLGEWLLAMAKPLAAAFDDLSEQTLIDHANHALTRTDSQVYELAKQVDKQVAKEGRS